MKNILIMQPSLLVFVFERNILFLTSTIKSVNGILPGGQYMYLIISRLRGNNYIYGLCKFTFLYLI